jgi:hypothetical protein
LIVFQAISLEYSLGHENLVDPFPIGVIRTTLNRNLAACYPNIQDEVVHAFTDVLALDGSGEIGHLNPLTHSFDCNTDWKALPAMDTVLRMICRVSNRLFVGFPLCAFAGNLARCQG